MVNAGSSRNALDLIDGVRYLFTHINPTRYNRSGAMLNWVKGEG